MRRIRTLKPEMFEDADFGRLSDPAQVLWIGLITMADDEGRFLALTSGIVGDVFKFKAEYATAHLSEWIAEVRRTGSILFYKVDRLPYGAFRNWAKHQLINRPSPSKLPDPPEAAVVRDNGLVLVETRNGDAWKQRLRVTEKDVIVHDSLNEDSLNVHGTLSDHSQPRVRARVGARRSDPDPVVVDLSNHLAGRVRANDPRFDLGKAGSSRWLTDMRLLLADRGGDADEIRRVIDWAQSDEFERSNVLSPGKLRSRFTALKLKADKAAVVPVGGQRAKSIDEMVAEDARRRAAARQEAA